MERKKSSRVTAVSLADARPYGPDPVLRPPAMALEHPGSAASHALPNPELDTVASEACRRLTRSPATKSSLSAACCTTAAAILQKVLHILPSIVVGNFVTWLDSATRSRYRPCAPPVLHSADRND